MWRKMKQMLSMALVMALLPVGGVTGEAQAEEAPQTAAIPVETVETDAFAMDYFRFGSGTKTMVILPGLSVQSVMGAADAVAQAYAPLTEEFTIYLFDRRRELPESYSISDMARDTAEAFRVLGLEDIYLFGTSQGGMIAMTLAIEHPELVTKLVLGSTSACVSEEGFETLQGWIDLAKAGDREGLYLAFGEAINPPAVFEQYRELLIGAAETVTDEELARFVILAEGIRGFDVTEELPKIACPVLVIGDRDDRVLGAEASELIAEKLEGRDDCELFMYEGYGHAAYDNAPDYKERILHFFVPGGAD